MNLPHVSRGVFLVHFQDGLEDIDDIVHEVDRIVPDDDGPAAGEGLFQLLLDVDVGAGLGAGLGGNNLEEQPPACPIWGKVRVRTESDSPLIPGRLGVNIIAPRIDSTCDIFDFPESGIVKQFPRLAAAGPILTI